MGTDAHCWRVHDRGWVRVMGSGAISTGEGVFCEGASFGVGDTRNLFEDTKSDLCFWERDDCGDAAIFSEARGAADISGADSDAGCSGAKRVGGFGGGVWR